MKYSKTDGESELLDAVLRSPPAAKLKCTVLRILKREVLLAQVHPPTPKEGMWTGMLWKEEAKAASQAFSAADP